MKKIVTVIIAVLLIVGLAVGGIFVYNSVNSENEELTSEKILEKIAPASELTTAKTTYIGVLHYISDGIKHITQREYIMQYTAEIEASIDLSKVSVTPSDTDVLITIPKLEEPKITVLADSIEYFEQKDGLLGNTSLQDGVDSVKKAEEDVKNKYNSEELIKTAKTQTEVLITAMLEELVGERKIKFVYK